MKKALLSPSFPIVIATITFFSSESIAAPAPVITPTSIISGNGISGIYGISADGTVATGKTNAVNSRAFKWTTVGGVIDLGTLSTNNAGTSIGWAISPDGSIIVGQSSTDTSSNHAFRWTSNGMVDLGTLGTGNLGTSKAFDLSSDGNVIVGVSSIDVGSNHAFRWSSGNMEDLGTLATANAGSSTAYGVSADGNVVIGSASTDSGNDHAFRWSSNQMVDLGTLFAGNVGSSEARGVSSDGSVIVGSSTGLVGGQRAFRWTNNGMTDIGTLNSNNSGIAVAYAISADSSTIGGTALGGGNGSVLHAFLWRADTGMFDLTPNLLQRNSSVISINSDGSVAAGVSNATDVSSQFGRATLWKITWPTPLVTTPPVTTPPVTTPPVTTPPVTTPPSTTLPIVTMVDVENARSSRWNLAGETFNVMELARNRLNWLQNPCEVDGKGVLCIRGGTNYQTTNHVDDLSASLSVGYGITDQLSAGLNFSKSLAGSLPESYRYQGNDLGTGVWTSWRNTDRNGAWFATLSGSASQSSTNIKMKDEGYSDPGNSNPDIKGLSASLELGREMLLSSSVTGKISGGFVHDNLKQQSFTDTNNAFPFKYNAVNYRLNYAFLSLGADVSITPKLSWVSQISGEQNITSENIEFKSNSEYLGEVNRQEKITGTRWNLSSGLNYILTPSTSVSISPWAGNSALGEMSYGGGISVTGRF